MLDNNGIFTQLDLDAAQGLVLAAAKSAGVTVLAGSPEEQIANFMAQRDVARDSALYAVYNKMVSPVGSDLDIQNPGTPRFDAKAASGYFLISNSTGADIEVPSNTVMTAPNGKSYSTYNNTVTVPAMGDAPIGVKATTTGIDTNMPSGQSITVGIAGLTATNPQPLNDGRDIESGTEYSNRIIYNRSNNVSQQNTIAAVKELLDFYDAAKLYINNDSNGLPKPVQVPPNGYIAVVQFPSSTQASKLEIANCMRILNNRYEFGNAYKASSALHPVISDTVYTGIFPNKFYVIPAQDVQFSLSSSLNVSFDDNVDELEKPLLAQALAKFVAQNIVNFFGGSDGNASLIFNGDGSFYGAYDIPVIATKGILERIAPAFSIELIRQFIADENQITQIKFMRLIACTQLTIILDPLVGGESAITLDIGGPITDIDFKKTALFSDDTAWFDRYIYVDPSRITISIDEV